MKISSELQYAGDIKGKQTGILLLISCPDDLESLKYGFSKSL
jgi:hypothetical protein